MIYFIFIMEGLTIPQEQLEIIYVYILLSDSWPQRWPTDKLRRKEKKKHPECQNEFNRKSK